jgi:septal ring factor EnvC (AmiA/AmiB activator)
MIRVLATILVLLLCAPLSTVRAEKVHKIKRRIQIQQEKIGEVQKEIERGQDQIKDIRQKERLILERLDQMELQLQLFSEKRDGLRRELTSLRQEVTDKRDRLKQLNHELEKLRLLLGERLEALYKFGQQAYLNLLASAHDVSGFQHQWIYLRAIAEQDSKLILQIQERQIEERKLTQALADREERLSKLVAEIGQQKAEIEKVRGQQVALLQDIHNQEEVYQRYVAELATVSRDLRNRIDELQRNADGNRAETQKLPGGFVSNKGALPYPVRGKVVSDFGTKKHKKFGTTIRNSGIEIATAQLSPVVAVYGGQVLYSDRVKGYGKVIIIDHGDKYYTLTGHLAEAVKETGGQVKSGEVIGYAGYSPVAGEGGRVYFEVRHLGKALDPEAWLLPTLARASGPGAQ